MIDLSWSNDEVNQKVGELRGIEIGRAEGRIEGRKEGRQEGRQEGRIEGREETTLKTKLTLAQAMLHDGIGKDFINKYINFSYDEVEVLIKSERQWSTMYGVEKQ